MKLFFALATLLSLPFIASANPGAPTGKIAYVSRFQSGNTEVFVMNADGSHKIDVSRSSASDYLPQWSPDGSKLLFFSTRDGKNAFYVVNADGSGLTCVADNIKLSDLFYDIYPWASWSPDSRKISFTSVRANERNTLFVVNADGSNLVKLGDHVNDYGNTTWSADSHFVAFSSYNPFNGRGRIFAVSANGRIHHAMTPATQHCLYPRWSPDGLSIAFVKIVRTKDEYSSQLCVMNSDGSNALQLSERIHYATLLAWNPDSRRISFITSYPPSDNLYPCIINANGTGLRVSKNAINNTYQWSPDGAHLLLDFYHDGYDNLWSVSATAGLKQLTYLSNYSYYACWSFDSHFIAYVAKIQAHQQIFVMNTDGTSPINISRSTTSDFDPQWAPGSLASTGSTATLNTSSASS